MTGDIAIYGAGGFGSEVCCLIRDLSASCGLNFIGFFDDSKPVGTRTRYGAVLGGISELNAHRGKLGVVIAIATPSAVAKIYSSVSNPEVYFPNIVAPDVRFYDRESVRMGQGNIISYNSRVSCNVCFGDFNIINSGCCFGHDVTIGSFNAIQPETRISGCVTVGDNNFFGMRSTVLQNLRIGNRTRIGAGSFIMRNTRDGNLYMGNPAKKVEGI